MKNWILFGTFSSLFTPLFAQKKTDWQSADPQQDSTFGISLTKAYSELLPGKSAKTVTVAIIDSGVDTAQEDLKAVLWTNPADGSHGWNYISDPESGREDIVKLVGKNKDFYDSLAYTMVPENYRAGYQAYRRLAPQLDNKISAMKALVGELQTVGTIADSIVARIGRPDPTVADFKAYQPRNDKEKEVIARIVKHLALYSDWRQFRQNEIAHIIELAQFHLAHGLNIDNAEKDTNTGSADIGPDKLGPVGDPNLTAYHGTHVAGIIGAVRNNGIGIDGIADHVQIMMLKVNGTIRELRDSSLALAIRFAVDHGAKVVNLSLGKPYSYDKKDVDAAVKYAMKKDVLLIHAAGNSGEDLDKSNNYPNPVYADKSGVANAWIEVGASGPQDDASLPATFSNYGARSVDVFAPGVNINSTLPDNQYASWSGTSMAAPVVSGLAALIREYYPQLTASEVKEIICRTVVKSPYLQGKCITEGVINAYNALKLANHYDKNKPSTLSSLPVGK